ncbi:MAG: prepilin-type N-terminal cleavage/methylation domain-containing protein [Nitrospirae bacterium]|nr:MAG: prepilin-type N-terminal cleavage/methylation domain-containing protein [Nitrospirota bacterium]
MRKLHKRLAAGNEKGFTLIEMAIVLVIIGIIIGSIMKGRDVIKGSQIKEFANAYVGKWQTMVNQYYDKTGQNLADTSRNGGTIAFADNLDGYMDGAATDLLAADADRVRVIAAMRRVGIDPCQIVKSKLFDAAPGAAPATQCADSKNVGQTKVDGEFSANQTVTVGFTNLRLTLAGIVQKKNVLYFTGMPLDVAIAIDKIYDGADSGEGGSIVNLGCANDAANTGAAIAQTANAAANVASAPARWAVATNVNTLCTLGMILEH